MGFNNFPSVTQQDGAIIINGRRQPFHGGMSGRELVAAVGAGPDRQVTLTRRGGDVQLINPNKYYTPQELMGRDGRPVKASTIPARVKGDIFGGQRSAFSRSLITEQVYDVALHFAKDGLEFDEESADWVVFPRFRMPQSWKVPNSPLMILFPTDYPNIPPIGFYLPGSLSSPHGHFYSQAYHNASNAPIKAGWKWYCCYVKDGAWQPSRVIRPGDWKYGDNLWTYITLINEVLNGRED